MSQLSEALRGGRQCDRDGTSVIVSRQACVEAADKLEELEQRITDNEKRYNRLDRMHKEASKKLVEERDGLKEQLIAYEAGKRDATPEWQPIETAPKDGTAFRAYADELIDLDFNPWGSVEAAWNGEEFIGCVWNGQQDSWYGKTINPSHWMPLPAAPKGEE